MERYLSESTLLDFSSKNVQELINKNKWNQLDNFNKIKQIYNFVRDDIKFGFNASDNMSASKILKDGYGQCNTKTILAMALLRGVDIPCRIHGFTLDKRVQSELLGILDKITPTEIIHTWIEVYYEEQWYQLEGLILDKNYLTSIQQKYNNCQSLFWGWGIATKDLQNPQISWNLNNTFIQKEGIIDDLGIFDTPDDFFNQYSQKIGWCKNLLYKYIGRHYINRNVQRIRNKL